MNDGVGDLRVCQDTDWMMSKRRYEPESKIRWYCMIDVHFSAMHHEVLGPTLVIV